MVDHGETLLHVDGLDVHELADPEPGELAPVARLPDPAEGEPRVRLHERVHEAGAGRELVAGDALAAGEVAREDGRPQAERAVVGDPDRLRRTGDPPQRLRRQL